MSSISPTSSQSLQLAKREKKEDQVMIVGQKSSPPQKVLEEEEYLDRMAKIIRRDFFSDTEFPLDNASERVSDSYRSSERSSRTLVTTPATDRTTTSIRSTTSSILDRQKACSMGLNEYLTKYTSEDNAYFEKLQKKELRRHRAKYPWLYDNKNKHNKEVKDQLKLPSDQERTSLDSNRASVKMIDWPYNSKNSLFYSPDAGPSRSQSTINYHSSKCMNEPIFKTPLPRAPTKPRSMNVFCDKIGIDGKLLNGSETPIINGYSFIPEPETPKIEEQKYKTLHDRFYIPNESPRDELAHRVYQEKVAKVIRTPKSVGSTPSLLKTPSSFRKGYEEFSFSPERVKNSTPKLRRNK